MQSPTIHNDGTPGWWEIASDVRVYTVKPLSGGYAIVGRLLDSTSHFGQNYGGAKDLDSALRTAYALAAHDLTERRAS